MDQTHYQVFIIQKWLWANDSVTAIVLPINSTNCVPWHWQDFIFKYLKWSSPLPYNLLMLIFFSYRYSQNCEQEVPQNLSTQPVRNSVPIVSNTVLMGQIITAPGFSIPHSSLSQQTMQLQQQQPQHYLQVNY